MRKAYTLFLIIFLFILIISSLGFSKAEPVIRIGIKLNTRSVSVFSKVGFSVYDPHGLILVTKDPNIFQFEFVNGGISFLSYHKKRIKVVPNGGTIKVGNRTYRGYIELYPSTKGGMNVVNVLPLEDYLKGVIRMEISEKWPINAIESQVIIARTFALYNWNKHKKEDFNLCATTHCQLYGGVTHESFITNRAVDDTRGLILTYKGKPIDSVYHSASGGYTEDSEYVWGKYIPYLRAVKSDFEHPTKSIDWEFQIDGQTLRKKVYKWYRKDIGNVYDIVIDKLSPHGRIYKLSLLGSKGRISLKGTNFRFLVGVGKLKSTFFAIERLSGKKKVMVIKKIDNNTSITQKLKEKDDWTMEELIALLKEDMSQKDKEVKIVKEEKEVDTGNIIFLFKGRGLGHGVGLSQWGAKALAEMGYNYKDILKYYYHNVKLIRLYR